MQLFSYLDHSYKISTKKTKKQKTPKYLFRGFFHVLIQSNKDFNFILKSEKFFDFDRMINFSFPSNL